MTTQDLITITKAAIRASREQIGMKEFPVLLLSRDGITSDKMAQLLGITTEQAKGRINSLVNKRQVVRVTPWNQIPAVYKPTKSGMEIIERILPTMKLENEEQTEAPKRELTKDEIEECRNILDRCERRLSATEIRQLEIATGKEEGEIDIRIIGSLRTEFAAYAR